VRATGPSNQVLSLMVLGDACSPGEIEGKVRLFQEAD